MSRALLDKVDSLGKQFKKRVFNRRLTPAPSCIEAQVTHKEFVSSPLAIFIS